MKRFLSVLTLMLFVVLTSYSQHERGVAGFSTCSDNESEMAGNPNFATRSYYSISFQCTGGNGSGVIRKQGSYTNLCDGTDNLQEGYYATYTFLPNSGCSLSHLYVNSVDMLNDLSYYQTSSGMSYSWSVNNIHQNYIVRAVFNQSQSYSVNFQCTGTGSGTIRKQGSYTSLCGGSDNLQEGYYATYTFLPYSGSSLSHLYVNNVDMINELNYYDTGSGMSYSWSVENIRQNYTVRAVFNQSQSYSVNLLCTGTGSGIICKQGSYTNLCGETDNIQEGYYATYNFIPNSGSSLSHLYVNNVDVMSDLDYYETGSGMSHSWAISNVRENYTIRAVFNQTQYYSVNFQCTGNGSGRVTKEYYSNDLCGGTDNIQEGYYATYNFLPSNGSSLRHLFVNDVDRINELSPNYSYSGVSYSWRLENVRQNYTIRAVFDPSQTYSVNFTCAGNGSGQVSKEYYSNDLCGSYDNIQEGFYATYNFIPNYGSDLDHLFVNEVDRINEVSYNYGSSGLSYSWSINNVRQNYSVRCIFSTVCYGSEISVESNNPNLGTVQGGGCYDYGSYAELFAIPVANAIFLGWNDGNTENPRTVFVNGDATYVALFADATTTYTINVVSANLNQGSVAGGGAYLVGSEVIITATPNDGYRFLTWDDGNAENPRTIIVLGDATYIANFEPIPTYTITVYSINDSYGSAVGGGTYQEGSSVTIRAIPANGYVFTSWYDGNVENPRTIIVTGDATYIANFADITSVTTYTIDAISANEEQGNVTGGGIYAEGTIITIGAIPRNGYRFKQWDDGNTDNPRIITVTEDLRYIASFEEIPTYTITVLSGNEAFGHVTGGGIYLEGSVITITAIPSPRYVFTQWNDGNTDNPRQITVVGDATYIATFNRGNGIEENISLDISIFPNPVTDMLNITSSETISHMEIISSLGQIVSYVELNSDNASYNIENLANGMYLVRFYNGNKLLSQRKFIKQ